MKIIKDGRNVEHWEAAVVCEKKHVNDIHGCGAVMEITAKDIFLVFWEEKCGSHRFQAAIQCPQCQKYNYVTNVSEPTLEMIHTERNRNRASLDRLGSSDSATPETRGW